MKLLFKNYTKAINPLVIALSLGFIFLIAMFIGLGASINNVFVIGILL